MIEIYSDRIEISNPGQPLISVERFIDEYQSRNDSHADIMRRLGICEEKGSGMDTTIFSIELFQLPPLRFHVQESRTPATIFYTFLIHAILTPFKASDGSVLKIKLCVNLE